jgi:hypothetical protein
MATANVYSAFQRVRRADGSYDVVYPISTSEEVYVDIDRKYTLTMKIRDMDATITKNKESIVEDILSLMVSIAPMFPRPVLFNHVYADDFSNKSTVNISKGNYIAGKIYI